MARPGGTLLDLEPEDWTPIFADREREYAYVSEVAGWEAVPGGAALAAKTDSQGAVRLRVVFVWPEVVRVQAWLEGGEEPPPASPMLTLRQAQGERVRVRLREDEDGLTISSGALRVRIPRRPWSMSISDRSGRALWGLGGDDRTLLRPTVLPLGFSRGKRGRADFHEAWSLAPDERLYGLGEQFGPFDKRGQRIVSWSRDPYGAVTGTVTYLNIPFVLSSRGYGVFVHHHSKTVYELGNPSPQSAAFRVADPYLDYFFVYGPSLKEVIVRYGELTGRPLVPPLWSFGVWWSRCMYRERSQVEGIVERLRELGLPGDVVHLDPRWQKGRAARRADGVNFEWDEEAWGEPGEFIEWLRERGFRLSLWENPYVWKGTAMFDEGARRGYLVKAEDGGLAQPLENRDDAALVDFTDEGARRWWQDKHRRYLRLGVASFKTDYGEGVPRDAVFSDGRSGEQAHNLYPLLYNEAVFEVIQEERGEAVVFGRSGYAGSQRYPINWTGDAPCTWGGLAATLRAGLSLSLSGISMWSHDIGGFWNPSGLNPPEPELYVRWAQFGLLSSHSRFHGIRGREPWYYGAEAAGVVRKFGRLRYRLLPYIWSLAHEAAATGLPVVRPLVLEYPDDPVSASVDFEYLLGPYLLVAPVLNREGRCRVYLPAGHWYDWWTGERLSGPLWRERIVPLRRLPLYVRGDSILPLAPPMLHTEEKPWEPLTLEVRLDSSARIELWDHEQRVEVGGERRGREVRLRIGPSARRYEVRFLEPAALSAVAVAGARRAAVRQTKVATVVRFRADGPCEVRAGVL
ncbi:MAG: DUF4968 domain-containing protein [Chloroflexi bacterium]|nr:DUF4968 domain-containing protein [Chloroflexota bacterium]